MTYEEFIAEGKKLIEQYRRIIAEQQGKQDHDQQFNLTGYFSR